MAHKTKMGRRPLPKDEKRSRLLSVKMNEAEWSVLVGLCAAKGMQPSECVRSLIAVEAVRKGVTS